MPNIAAPGAPEAEDREETTNAIIVFGETIKSSRGVAVLCLCDASKPMSAGRIFTYTCRPAGRHCR